MLKAAIEKIQELCKVRTEVIEGVPYLITGDGYEQIKPDLEITDNLILNSLDSLVQMVKTEALPKITPIYITIPSHLTVRCFTQPMDSARNQRLKLYDVKATDVPGWGDNVKLSFEEAMISLRTRFQDTPDNQYALKLLSDITSGSKITLNDNGIATSVVTKKGIDLQSNMPIKPIVRLKPYRTFQEVEQPESQFLIRVGERGISFIEADGGMWKLEARKTIYYWLSAHLGDEIRDGSVVLAL